MASAVDALDQARTTDRLGNPLEHGLPYARGRILRSSEDDYRKLQTAWRVIAGRSRREGPAAIYNLSGLERSLPPEPADQADLWADDDLAPAYNLEKLVGLGLEHLGGDPGIHELAIFNRLTAATYATHITLVQPDDTVVGVSASYSHPSVTRAARHVGAQLVDTKGYDAFAHAMETEERVSLVVLTRLAVTYDILSLDDIRRIVDLAHTRNVPVYVDDAGGARVGPAIFDQPRMLELGVDIGATGLDKYGTIGPRLGLMGGRRDLVSRIRARGFEMGLEARPMLYSRVRHSLEQYRPERVRALVDTALAVGRELVTRLGPRIRVNGLIAELAAEDTFELALARSNGDPAEVVPYEATAALAMLLLRDYGVMTVHFAGVPPGTSSILFKFIPPETLERFGGAEKFAEAVDESLDRLGEMITSGNEVRTLLLG